MKGVEVEMTKIDKIRKHLKEQGSITSYDAFTFYRATRLSAIIFTLRKQGMLIDMDMVHKRDKEGNPICYGIYTYRGEAE